MSVLDELRELEDRVTARMRELRPLVDEYRDLEQIAHRLGLDDSAAVVSDRPGTKRRPSRRQAKPAAASARPAAKGSASASPAAETSASASPAAKSSARARPGAKRSANARPAAKESASAGSTARRSRRRGGMSAATPSANGARGDRRRQVLEAVNEQPGITVREIGERLGVDYTSLYRHVRALEAEGTITKRGRTLQPV